MMARQIRMLGDDAESEQLTTLVVATVPLVPAVLYNATGLTRLKQVIARNRGDRDTEFSLEVRRRGGRDTLVLADRLTLSPGGVAELVGRTSLGFELMLAGDSIFGTSEYPATVDLLAYGIADA